MAVVSELAWSIYNKLLKIGVECSTLVIIQFCMIRLCRRLQFQRAFSSRNQRTPVIPEEFDLTKLEGKFWVMPVTIPLFSGYTYLSKMCKIQTELFKKHQFQYVVAMPLQDDKNSNKIVPESLEALQKMAGLQHEVPAPKDSLATVDTLQKQYCLKTQEDAEENSVSVLRNIDDVFPMGSLCKVFFSPQNENLAYLRPDLRIKIDPKQYEGQENIFFVEISEAKYKTGKEASQSLLSNNSADEIQLQQILSKIRAYEPILWPAGDSIKWEMWSGYFFNTTVLFTRSEAYKVFEAADDKIRLGLLIECFKKYHENFQKRFQETKKSIPKADDDKILKASYDHIKKSLESEESDVTKYVDEVRKELLKRARPQAVVQIIESELLSISEVGKDSHEFPKKKSYITYLLEYPFSITSKDSTNLDEASNILDEDHYGMKKVKERILEFIAVGKLKGSFKSKALILHGPPGVGKSSIAKSIARCLGRSYERISLGGQVDPELLRGHRRTYVASYPGKIFTAINRCKTVNPVILLDEIDKIDIRRNGSSLQDVILEVLDPMQNTRFKDNFLQVDIDLSNILFICTANTLDTISPPLLDRLEQIEVSGYTLHEKSEIFKRYLLKKAMEDSGLNKLEDCKLQFTDDALDTLIDNYCREAGVRSLSQETQKLCQKIARKYVEGQTFSPKIDKKGIKNYLGEPKYFRRNNLTENPLPGMAIGLAYTGLGGCTLPIESSKSNLSAQKGADGNYKKGSLLITGNLKDVMKESCQIAYTYAKYVLSTFMKNDFLEVNDVHINFPELEIGKDGPSAGGAITTTFISLALNKPMIKKIGMTGEINLSGEITKIGGVKEKILGARRDGVLNLIFPYDNKREVEELEPEVKQGVNIVFVRHYFDIMKEVFDIDVTQPLSEATAT